MDLIVRNDINKFAQDAQAVRSQLDVLEQDRNNWARESEERDLEEVIEFLKVLESDVSILESDCITSTTIDFRREKNPWSVYDILHKAFARLDILFKDIKSVKTGLNESYINTVDLEKLEIDWRRFQKMIPQIRESLQEGVDLREIDEVLSSFRGKREVKT